MRAVADVTRGVVRATVDIEAPPAAVFDALTQPDQLASWWGGDRYRTYDWQMDLRVGGAWSVKADAPDGLQTVYGEILELEPPHHLTYTWHASWDGHARTVVRFELAAMASGTRVTVVHDGFAGRPEACEGHAAGWDLVLGWLTDHAAGGPSRDGGDPR